MTRTRQDAEGSRHRRLRTAAHWLPVLLLLSTEAGSAQLEAVQPPVRPFPSPRFSPELSTEPSWPASSQAAPSEPQRPPAQPPLLPLSTGPVSAQLEAGEPPARPFKGPRFSPEFTAELGWPASSQADPSEPHRPRAQPRQSERISPAMAFNQELRLEAIDYRYTNPWAYADENLRGDRPVREGRARAAEDMLGDAAGAAGEVILREAFNRPSKENQSGPPSRGLRHQLRVDTNPTWRMRTRVGLTHLRFDLPLTAHDELGFNCSRRIDSDRRERHFGASLRANPWEESIRIGFEFEF